jgi:transposase-like protein
VKKSRFTDEQIAFAVKQAETGTRIDEICRKMGISDATFYKWRQKYGADQASPQTMQWWKASMEDFAKNV